MVLCILPVFGLLYNNHTAGMAGYGTLAVQQYDVYDDLAEILETDFTGGNKILTEMQDFYHSCIVAEQMNQTEAIILPVRKFFEGLGQCCDSTCAHKHCACCTYTAKKRGLF